MAFHDAAAAQRQVAQSKANERLVEVGRIMVLYVPANHVAVLVVRRDERGFEKRHGPRRAAHVLGRPAALPVHEYRVVGFGFAVEDALDGDLMAPTVAEVVLVGEPPDAPRDERSQPQSGRPVEPEVPLLVVVEGDAVVAITDGETKQVRVGPAESDLNDAVQCEQRAGQRHVDPAPFRRANVLELDAKACDGFVHGRIPERCTHTVGEPGRNDKTPTVQRPRLWLSTPGKVWQDVMKMGVSWTGR